MAYRSPDYPSALKRHSKCGQRTNLGRYVTVCDKTCYDCAVHCNPDLDRYGSLTEDTSRPLPLHELPLDMEKSAVSHFIFNRVPSAITQEPLDANLTFKCRCNTQPCSEHINPGILLAKLDEPDIQPALIFERLPVMKIQEQVHQTATHAQDNHQCDKATHSVDSYGNNDAQARGEDVSLQSDLVNVVAVADHCDDSLKTYTQKDGFPGKCHKDTESHTEENRTKVQHTMDTCRADLTQKHSNYCHTGKKPKTEVLPTTSESGYSFEPLLTRPSTHTFNIASTPVSVMSGSKSPMFFSRQISSGITFTEPSNLSSEETRSATVEVSGLECPLASLFTSPSVYDVCKMSHSTTTTQTNPRACCMYFPSLSSEESTFQEFMSPPPPPNTPQSSDDFPHCFTSRITYERTQDAEFPSLNTASLNIAEHQNTERGTSPLLSPTHSSMHSDARCDPGVAPAPLRQTSTARPLLQYSRHETSFFDQNVLLQLCVTVNGILFCIFIGVLLSYFYNYGGSLPMN